MISRIRTERVAVGLILGATVLAAPGLRAFSYVDFGSAAGLNLVGDAAQMGTAVRLTPNLANRMGSAWYATPQHVADGFNTTFSFRITDPVGPGADGISFSIQNQGIGAYADEQGTSSSIAVSFNTFQYGDEPSGNFVGIYYDGFANIGPLLHFVNLSPLSIELKDGAVHTASLDYNGSGLTLTLDSVPVFSSFPISLAAKADASGNAFIGFGARTGVYADNHDLLSWSFTPVPEPAPGVLFAGALAFFGLGHKRRASNAH